MNLICARRVTAFLYALACVSALLAVASPSPGSDLALVPSYSGDLQEVSTRSDARRQGKLSAQVYVGQLTVLGGFAGAACTGALTSFGGNVPADVACAVLGIATLAYGLYGFFADLGTRSVGNSYLSATHNILHYFPGDHATSTLEKLEAAYDGTNRVLVAHHQCESNGCYNIFYRHYDTFGSNRVHHLALEPRGHWQSEVGDDSSQRKKKEHVAGTHNLKSSNHKKLFADYFFYNNQKSAEKAFGNTKNRKTVEKDFVRAVYVHEQQLKKQGYFCMDWEVNKKTKIGPTTLVGTLGVLVQSEGEHISDPDMMPTYLKQCS